MTTPNDKEGVNFNDISFDDFISDERGSSLDTLELLDDESEIKAVEENPSIDTTNELEADVAMKKVGDDSIIEPTDKDDVDKEEIEAHFEKESSEKNSTDVPAGNSVVAEVLESLGFRGDYEYEDTPEGLKTLTLDVANKLAEEQLDGIMESFPLVQQHLQYVMNGGKSEDFMRSNDPQSDYNNLSLTEKDTPMQKVVLSNYFRIKGHEPDMIKELIEDYEDSGKLFAKAELAKTALGTAQQKQKAAMLVQQQESNNVRIAEEKRFWHGIHTTIQEKNELAGITIPSREKNNFYKYVSAPVNKQGQTQSMVDAASSTLEQRLLIDYLMFKGLNLKDIIATKAQSQTTKTLKDRIRQAESATLSNAKPKTKVKTGLDFNDLDLKSLLS